MIFGSRNRADRAGLGRAWKRWVRRLRSLTRVAAPVVAAALLFGGCAGAPPTRPDNLCAVFREKPGWYRDAAAAGKRWDVPVPVIMAIMHRESKFRPRARPPRTRCLWIFPGPRPSSAYGYPQAIDGTWDWYRERTGNRRARRTDFGDAVDFIGWYGDMSQRLCGIAKTDAYRLYLAYHEGHAGYNRGNHRSKPWLIRVARDVSRQADRYAGQLRRCEDDLDRRPCFLWPF